jgi:tetratricopeptide (TPR) repeat protein
MRPVQMMLKLWMLAPYPLLVCLIALLLLLTFTPVSATPLRQEGNSAELCEEGVAMFRNGQHAEALPLLEAGFAGREAEEFADPDDLGMCALVLGRLRDNTGDRIGALEAYEVALRQFQNSDIRELEGITVNNMGLVYYNQGHYDDALEHYE